MDDDRYASPGAVAVGAAGVAAATSSRQAASPAEDPDDEPDWAADDAASASRSSGSGPSGRSSSRGRQPSAPSSTSNDQVRRREPQEPSELFGPAWERPRRYEAYPSLRTRVGLPGIGGIGRVGAAALALVLAALILFFVGPMLLGVGKDSGKPGAVTATATPATEATPSAAPTEPPAPTPKIYIVAKGDTINKIAKKNGVTVAQLLAANQQIKNPNKIKIGDQITIPVPVSGADDGTLDGGASASP